MDSTGQEEQEDGWVKLAQPDDDETIENLLASLESRLQDDEAARKLLTRMKTILLKNKAEVGERSEHEKTVQGSELESKSEMLECLLEEEGNEQGKEESSDSSSTLQELKTELATTKALREEDKELIEKLKKKVAKFKSNAGDQLGSAKKVAKHKSSTADQPRSAKGPSGIAELLYAIELGEEVDPVVTEKVLMQIEREKKDLNKKIKALAKEVQDKESHIERMSQKILDIKKEKEILEEKVAILSSAEAVQELTTQITQLQNELKGAHKDRKYLQTCLSQLKAKLPSEEVKHFEFLTNEISSKDLIIEELRQQTEDYEIMIRDYSYKMSQEMGEAAMVQQEKQRRLENLQSQLDELNQKLMLAEIQLKEKDQQLQQQKQQILRKDQQIQEKDQILQYSQQQLQEKHRQLQQQNQEIQRKDQQIQENAAQLHEKEQQIREKDRRLQRAQQQVQQLQSDLSQASTAPWMISRDELILTEEKLGSGAYGEVKVAVFRGLRVAAKHLHNIIISDYNLRNFSREMTIASRVHHPNLLLFIGVTTQQDHPPIILTELMATSLQAELSKHPLSNQQIKSIASDVACGLNYLHQWKPHPIIHRDVSSPNVLMKPSRSDSWEAKVSDYGSANSIKLINSTLFPGNAAYAAPEAKFPDEHTPKMDVYSFGVLLTEMSLQEQPEMSITGRARRAKMVQWDPLADIIEECIAHSPKNRPALVQVMEKLRKIEVRKDHC